nr:PREDICTED: receptor-type tyrosine-protein phosphatase alpha isoform X2 [Tribolium castaneum]|eukprot:XP_015839750.1 PREDICTED: receptor-type tyrosine-protein phosphatase alpha isoform X2 [Tribolium castaneum]
MYLWRSTFVIILFRIVQSEIVTLSKENVIKCVVTGSVNYSSLYIDPPDCINHFMLRHYAKKNLYIEEATIDNQTCKCKAKNFKNDNYYFRNKPGYLDEKSNITCGDVLGENYPFCENYKLCVEDQCRCAWGYEEPACTKTCKAGYWGLSCRRKCDLDCALCHPKKGCICKKSAALQATDECYFKLHRNQFIFQRIFLTVLGLCLLVIGILVIAALYKKKKTELNTNIENVPLTKITVEDKENQVTETNILEESLILKKTNTSIGRNDFENTVIDKIKCEQIKEEFSALPLVTKKTTDTALKKFNINKNKNDKHLPYDYNRVILKDMEGVGKGDYINASYIDGYNRPKAYIACPGPKFYTVKDFWRMIWQEQIETVVMTTNFTENKKRMAAEYFPQKLGGMFECASILIFLSKEENFEHYIKRTLEVRYNDCERTIQHLQVKDSFTSNNVLPILKKLRISYETTPAPILIHSGFAGTRTGILILSDLAIQMLKIENKVDFYELAKNLREQRIGMINQLGHYILAHLIVMEYLMDERFPFEINAEENIQIVTKNQRHKLEQQLKYVEKLHEFDKIVQSCLQVKNYSDCPTFVDGYGKNKKYIITTQPKTNFKSKFWLMVAHESTSCVVFLNKLQQNAWPFREETSNFVINVQILNRTDTPYYVLSKIALLVYGKRTKTKNISFYEYKNQTKQTLTAISIIKLICEIKKHSQIIVSCSDGVETIGIFLILSYVIQKYEIEMEIDVCNAIRIVRQSDTRFVNTLKSLEFIYTCISEYLRNFDDYNIINT